MCRQNLLARTLKEIIETCNLEEAMIYATQRSIDEIDGKVSEKEKRVIEEILGKLKASLSGGDARIISGYTDELLELVKGVTTKIQKVSQAKRLVSSVERDLRLSSLKGREEMLTKWLRGLKKHDMRTLKKRWIN